MRIERNDLKLIIFFLLFLIGGIFGGYSQDFIENNKALSITIKWGIFPVVVLAAYFAYRSTFDNRKSVPLWKRIFSFIVLTFIFGIMFLKAAQGYLVFYNCKLGEQEKALVKGEVVKVKYPKDKKLLNNYAIEIISTEKQLITLDVPTNNYYVTQTFQKEMIKSSLGILYSPH